MITDKILQGEKCTLRQIEMEDCTQLYVAWLNDPEVNRYLETRWSEQTMETVRDFVRQQRESEHSVLFAIISNESGRHIGNIKIGPVRERYRRADISYFIGEESQWRHGIATEAVRLICRFGFEELKLHRIEAGAYECALGSQRVLEKNHFIREGVFSERAQCDGKWIDVYRYGLLEKYMED